MMVNMFNQFICKNTKRNNAVPGSFLVESQTCKIPNQNPFSQEAMKIFNRVPSINCSRKRPLTSIHYEAGDVFLVIHDEVKQDFLYFWQREISVSNVIVFS